MPHKDPEARRAYKAEYHKRHAEEIRERAKQWERDNPEKATAKRHRYMDNGGREKARERRLSHAEETRAYRAVWDKANRDKLRAYAADWYRAHPERAAAERAKRRARLRNATVSSFSYEAVLWRDGYRCHICAGDVVPGEIHYDHVIPLSRGGEHSYDNVRVAHATCNLRKGSKVPVSA